MAVTLDPLHDIQPVPILPDMPQAGALSVAPPTEQLPSIIASIEKAVQAMPEGADIAAVGRATAEGGWQAAVIVKAAHGWNVHAWVGDPDWGGPAPIDYGVEVLKVWKF